MDVLAILNLIGGIIYLFMGGDLLVRGSIAVARRFQMSPAIIGATILAFGTSAPELIVSVLAAAQDHSGISIGNVVGSNIANVLVVLGVPALLTPIVVKERTARFQGYYMLIATLLFIGLAFTAPFTVWHGVVLVAGLAIGYGISLSGVVDLVDLAAEEEEFERVLGLPERQWIAWCFIGFGIVAMPLGADLSVGGATKLALSAGVSEAAIAASIIALGTSLPELSATIIAVRHGQMDMAVGNIVGSNVFNLLFVVGLTALFTTVDVPATVMSFDIWAMLASALLLVGILVLDRTITRSVGVVFVVAYFVYLYLIF